MNPTGITNSISAWKKTFTIRGKFAENVVRSLATDMIFLYSPQKLSSEIKLFNFHPRATSKNHCAKKNFAFVGTNKNEARKFNIFQFNQIS